MADHIYKFMTTNEQVDIHVGFMLSQEKDLYCHETNMKRYDAMLLSLPEGAFKTRIQQLRADTASRISEISAIIAAEEAQLPSDELIAMAKVRLGIEVKPVV